MAMATPRTSFSAVAPQSPTPLERPSSSGEHGAVTKEMRRKACIDFLLQENYLLTAFELLHELQEDGLVESATKLQLFFANSDLFPPDELARMQALQGSDCHSVSSFCLLLRMCLGFGMRLICFGCGIDDAQNLCFRFWPRFFHSCMFGRLWSRAWC